MCRAVICKRCKKWTYEGCGNHKDTVLRNIPVTNRCTCKATNQNNVLQEYKPFSSGLSYSTKPSNPSRQ